MEKMLRQRLMADKGGWEIGGVGWEGGRRAGWERGLGGGWERWGVGAEGGRGGLGRRGAHRRVGWWRWTGRSPPSAAAERVRSWVRPRTGRRRGGGGPHRHPPRPPPLPRCSPAPPVGWPPLAVAAAPCRASVGHDELPRPPTGGSTGAALNRTRQNRRETQRLRAAMNERIETRRGRRKINAK